MSGPERLCEQYESRDLTGFSNGLTLGRYRAAVTTDELPKAAKSEKRAVSRGYAVGFGEWMFFGHVQPAVAFARAARTSHDCRGRGVYEAAREVRWCDAHGDELLLHVRATDAGLVDGSEEVAYLKEFVRRVEQNPDTAHPMASTR